MTRGTAVRIFLQASSLWFYLLLVLFASPSLAETIELVTYYPSPGGADTDAGRLHADRATIGDTPYSLQVPAGLTSGTLLVADAVGIGPAFTATAPQGALHVVGTDDAPDQVLFMPGSDTAAAGAPEIRVGVGIPNPTTRLAVGGLLQSQIPLDARYNVQLGYLAPSGMPSIGLSANLHADTTVNLVSNTRPARAVVITAADDALSFSRNANGAAQDAAAFNPTLAPHPMMVMKLDSGNVGIGQTAPAARLEVRTAGQQEFIRLSDSAGNDSAGIFVGAGTPNGAVTAQLGSLYINHASGQVYRKATGDGTNSGWVELGDSGPPGLTTVLLRAAAVWQMVSNDPGAVRGGQAWNSFASGESGVGMLRLGYLVLGNKLHLLGGGGQTNGSLKRLKLVRASDNVVIRDQGFNLMPIGDTDRLVHVILDTSVHAGERVYMQLEDNDSGGSWSWMSLGLGSVFVE